MKERSSCLQLIVSHSFWRQLPYGEHVCFHADTGVKKGKSSVMLPLYSFCGELSIFQVA